MADNININGIQIPQLPTEDSPAGFEAIGYKSGRTSKVSLDTLATKVELQNTVVGTNLLGSKANVAAIKSDVTTPKKGDTYKATDTGHYWKYNDVISETNPYDPNKWVDIGIVIPSDVMLNGGSTKTGAQLDAEKLDKTVLPLNTEGYNDESVTLPKLSESLKQYIESSGGGTITNFPDEEDLTVKDNNLKFNNKSYVPNSQSGLGRNYVRKNISNSINVFNQDLINQSDTIYHIQYDYNLQGQTITLPANVVLNFEGGSFSNGSLVFNNTKIITNRSGIFNSIQVSGIIQNNTILLSWWSNVEYGELLNNLIASNDYITIDKDIEITTPINIQKGCTIVSDLKNIISLTDNNSYIAGINITSGNVTINNIHLLLNDLDVKGIYAHGSSEAYIGNININNVDVSHFGSKSGIDFEYVENSQISKCKVFDSTAYNGSVSLGAIYAVYSSNIRVESCDVYNVHPKGINFHRSQNCIATNCFVTDTTSIYAIGIYTQESDHVVYDNCIVTRAKGSGCKISSKSNNVIVKNCSFIDISGGYAIAMQGSSNSIFENCYIETSTTILVDAHPDANGSDAYNNSISGCTFKCTGTQPYLFDVRQGASKTGGGMYNNILVRIENNTIINDGYSIIFNAGCSELYINNNIINNPINCVRSYLLDSFEFNNNIVNYSSAKSGDIYIILLTGNQKNRNIIVRNNTINANQVTSNIQAFYFSGIEQTLEVSNNKLFGSFKGGFNLSGDNVIVTDNEMQGITGFLPVIITNTTTVKATGNRIKNCDSAFNSIDITSVSGIFTNNKAENSGKFVAAFSKSLQSVVANNNDNINFINYPTIGTTANRPTLSSTNKGFQYYDITINKPMWWNGSNWVDGTGTTVI